MVFFYFWEDCAHVFECFCFCDLIEELVSVTIKRNRESIASALLEAKKQRHVSMEETSQCNKVHRSKQHSVCLLLDNLRGNILAIFCFF